MREHREFATRGAAKAVARGTVQQGGVVHGAHRNAAVLDLELNVAAVGAARVLDRLGEQVERIIDTEPEHASEEAPRGGTQTSQTRGG